MRLRYHRKTGYHCCYSEEKQDSWCYSDLHALGPGTFCRGTNVLVPFFLITKGSRDHDITVFFPSKYGHFCIVGKII